MRGKDERRARFEKAPLVCCFTRTGFILGVVLWLRGLTIGKRSYNAIIEFVRVNGMQEGEWFVIVG